MTKAPENGLNRHRDCIFASDREDGYIFCNWYRHKYAANEVTPCSCFRAAKLKATNSEANPRYGQLKGPRLAVTRVGK